MNQGLIQGTNLPPVLGPTMGYSATGKIVGSLYMTNPMPVGGPSLAVCPNNFTGLAAGCVLYGPPVVYPWDLTFITMRMYNNVAVSAKSIRIGTYNVDPANGLPTGQPTTLGTMLATSTGQSTITVPITTLRANIPQIFAFQFEDLTISVWGYGLNANFAPYGQNDALTPGFNQTASGATLTSAGTYANGLPDAPKFVAGDVKYTTNYTSIPALMIVCAA